MNTNIYIYLLSCFILLFSSCGDDNPSPPTPDNSSKADSIDLSQGSSVGMAPTVVLDPNKTDWSIPVRQLSDQEYPDNPDISIRHKLYDQPIYQSLEIKKLDNGNYTFINIPTNESTDTLIISNINIMEWIPFVPDWIQSDEYLTYIGIINQEWNRHQVKFNTEQFELKGGNEKEKITRVDLARNCLNAYLWEIIVYAEEDGKTKPYYHSWFDFPKDLYAGLFKKRNSLDYEKFRKPLEDWIEPEYKKVDLTLLRDIKTEQELVFENHNNELYPLIGERKKKNINIIHPKNVRKIQDFLTDDTRYATFTPPGFYNTKDPRVTELSRFATLEKITQREVIGKNPNKTPSKELELTFRRSSDSSLMHFIIGGLAIDQIPQRPLEEMHKGWQMSMGIANHSFYESYDQQQASPSYNNPFYALLLDGDGNWLDSHKIGIDGPLLHFDKNDPQKLHLWILSFERHSFVGHFSFNLENITDS